MKIERRYMAHYLNAGFGGEENYCRLGADLEEYSPELTANVEKKSNILGQTSVTIDGYQKQGEVSPYYAEVGDPLFEKLQAIIDGDLVLDDLKTDIVEVKLWGETADDSYPSFTMRQQNRLERVMEGLDSFCRELTRNETACASVELCIVSYGGDTTGYQIPFNVHYTGVKRKGKFDIKTKKFTAE